MKITTSDGRAIELNRGDKPVFGAPNINFSYYEVYCTLVDEADKPLKYHGTLGRYVDGAQTQAILDALQTAWANGAAEFTMPQDTYDPYAFEKFNDFCAKHHLTLATAQETLIALPRNRRNLAEARRLAYETDYWERRGVLIADEYGSYAKSLAKWQSLKAGDAA